MPSIRMAELSNEWLRIAGTVLDNSATDESLSINLLMQPGIDSTFGTLTVPQFASIDLMLRFALMRKIPFVLSVIGSSIVFYQPSETGYTPKKMASVNCDEEDFPILFIQASAKGSLVLSRHGELPRYSEGRCLLSVSFLRIQLGPYFSVHSSCALVHE